MRGVTAATARRFRSRFRVVASGEQVTAGLLAIVLEGIGVNARSWQGWQSPIVTSNAHGAARILAINGGELVARFKERGEVAVIAGFQGLHKDTGRITTLGRGGSDTSAVAIAAAIQASRCDIYTDVDGVYTTDPRIVAKARKLDRVTYEEMLEMASLGAKVLETRSVALAMRHRVRLQVLSSFEDRPGTLVVDEDEVVGSKQAPEERRVRGRGARAAVARPALDGEDRRRAPAGGAPVGGAEREADPGVPE